ncbi:reverse transcriptase (RNA-dependent DNA polymerase) domain-containing protein [Pochonia chlamydosporia 170]|uniref:Reverse transcriptase (RNA-dependent DNA polymerase) domain-containing protein n=1 Tax=Pochonia chlamydosporia 170 TaxID=1380566 RepID=A0A179EVJ5_METCM|nr:reverse transcriptase (RNA-dependent DNA polymerase) domain-containing protein [Pochonia chlamydosporia 170]XP_022284938.1 reverse transcriptase (RNA-dependent DNA polymerase) domain-containing protein [Pochonia chlamydosporia 170]OAQ57234.1 reverse transcriptase (RNA-dependent DNA polymerase) domain-containing protein [Pochonia chlamydosporia 170]OWT42414.1 reverse transcriptase (RNA-dependent DNA polymerase) domain-containing protein [Pochonia chlamydosporia 170]
MAAKPGVFQFPGVQLPEDIAYMLAVNHKYILHAKPQVHDVAAAKDRFARTVRIRWQFRNNTSNKEYIPKFHVPNPFWEPQKASSAIELGLDNAMEEIDRQVSRALATMATQSPNHGNMNWTRVQQFLNDNDLLVKLTDKNLGLAVFQKEWYIQEIHKMLGSNKAYKIASDLDMEQLLDTLYGQLQRWKLPKNMTRFIREKTASKIPEFHAIPKVHKMPWALRPIVPSHSWVTSRVSEVVDHLCRPILDKLPWVVDSSKKVINNLSKIRIESDNVWICTGDVVAFYTNINARACCKVVCGAWHRYASDSKIPTETISQMIKFVMENNYFSFQDQVWKQLDGLAMGTSCAPLLANIYAAYYERKRQLVYQPGVRLYNRYIDDILVIFEGTRKELMHFLNQVKLGPLTINWDVSLLKKEFLDIEILKSRDQSGPKLVTRLFKKQMNRHLYIPWSSAHPLHVKKAFVKAELIRFAIISSEVEYFADARSQFYGNLRRRGYPSQVLENWFKQVSYEQRAIFLSPKEDKEMVAPLMLSGRYNPVWEYINVDEILRSAREGWNLERNLPETLQQPLIRSLSRHTSLFDLLSAWNKTILHTDMLSDETDGE